MDELKVQINKYHLFILPIVSVLIGVGLLVVIVQQAVKIPSTNSEINQNRQTLALVKQKISDLEAINLDQYAQDLNTALVSLPTEKDIPGVFDQISGYMKINGLSLSDIALSNQDQQITGASTYSAKISALGNRTSIDTFINQLKESPKVLKVDNLSATSGKNSDSLDVLLSINAFFQPAPKSQTLPPDQPLNKPDQKNFQTLSTIKGYVAKQQQLFAAAATSSGLPSTPLGKPDPFQ